MNHGESGNLNDQYSFYQKTNLFQQLSYIQLHTIHLMKYISNDMFIKYSSNIHQIFIKHYFYKIIHILYALFIVQFCSTDADIHFNLCFNDIFINCPF